MATPLSPAALKMRRRCEAISSSTMARQRTDLVARHQPL